MHECPTGIPRNINLFAYNNVCIELFHNQNSWFDSRKHCQKHGGDLVVIQDKTKQTLIIKGQTTIYKHIYKTKDRVTRTPLKKI
jgi:hypothetical protein